MTTTKPQFTTEPDLKPCRCGRKALIERFHDGDDPQPLFVATCEVCPVKTYDQFTAEEAARIWNEFVSATVNIPEGHWQRVQIKAGNPRVVAIQFETAEQATAFINSFAVSPPSAAPVVDNSVAFNAYNQAIEDAKAAIRAETTDADGSGFFSATFINAIARKCSPHVYVNRLAAAATAVPVERSGHDSCSHWREDDSDNCVWCGEDLGPTTETDVSEGAR